ncbi:hypothetical protein [Actinocrispum sp. NPDC049592]|uniref:hypothetical protein n=1 Tax=Actinocrispum sp. NPDC049592 TaxID=3154835 RepID=UPI0034159BD3
MVTGKNDIGMDHEVVAEVGKDLAAFADAVAAVREYAHSDDGLTADKFGVLAQRSGVGQTYVQLREQLRNALDKAGPIVEAMSRSLASSQKLLTETDADVKQNIAKVDGSF